MDDRIYRSRRNRLLAGVAGGLAERYGADVSVIRVAWVLLALVSGGLFALVYLVMALVVPEAPEGVPGAAPPGGTWQGAGDATGGASTPGAGSWTPAGGSWIDWDLVWPVIVIGLGAVLIAAAIRRGSGSRPG